LKSEVAIANWDFGESKLRHTAERYRRDETRLTMNGWRVVLIWEHENPELVADRVHAMVRNLCIELRPDHVIPPVGS
jgi:G:T-mismatch repair DNA endonuclease (very short patch repair protein)